MEKNHPNRLEYFCKEHNQLCCANCIAKLNINGDGQHKDCDVCDIKSILTDTLFVILTLVALIVMLLDIVLALVFLQSDKKKTKKNK